MFVHLSVDKHIQVYIVRVGLVEVDILGVGLVIFVKVVQRMFT